MKVVEGGDGRGEVALGRVELLDVSRYFLDHSLALPGLVLDVSEDMHKPHLVVEKGLIQLSLLLMKSFSLYICSRYRQTVGWFG